MSLWVVHLLPPLPCPASRVEREERAPAGCHPSLPSYFGSERTDQSLLARPCTMLSESKGATSEDDNLRRSGSASGLRRDHQRRKELVGRKGSREEGELAAGPTGLDATAFAFSRIQTPPVISTSAHVSANSNPLSQGGHLGSSTQALYQRDSIPAPATRSVHRQHPLSTSHTLAAGPTLTPDTLSRPSSTFNSLVLTTTLECQQGLISSLPTLPPRHPSPSLAASTRPTSSTHPALSPEHSTTER